MQPTGIGIGWPWILGLSLLALLGLFLLWRGLRPRRMGTTPYCRKCGYNLTGTDRAAPDARCPECGTHLAEPNTILFGERRVRPRRVVVGVICLLLGLAPLTVFLVGELKQVDWYFYKPTAFVLRDIQSTSPALATKAIQEMTRRFNADALAPEQIPKLADVCLTVHAQPGQLTQVGMPAIHLLDAVYGRDLLTPEQTERFFSQMVDFSPLVRPLVTQGAPCYLGVKSRERGPFNKYRQRISIEDLRLDDESVRCLWRGGSRSYTGYSESDLGAPYAGQLNPGTHSVKIVVTFQVFDRDDSQRFVPESSTLHSEQRMVNASFEILEREPPDYFRFTYSPELDRAVAASISVSEFTLESDELAASFGVPTEQQGKVDIGYPGPHPIGLAFDVYAMFNGQRLGLGQITASKDSRYGVCGREFAAPVTGEIPKKVTIILRSSRDVALRTPDLYEIWDGELWFEDVEVVSEKATTQAWGPGGRFKPIVRRRDTSEDQAWPAVTRPYCSPMPLVRRPIVSGPFGIEDVLAKLAEQIAEQFREDPDGIDAGETPPESAAPTVASPDVPFEEMIEFSLRVRPVVVRNQEFFVGVAYENRRSPRAYRLRIRVKQIRFGSGATLNPHITFSTRTDYHSRSRERPVGTHTRAERPGKWSVEVDVEYQFDTSDSTGAWLPNSSALYSGKCTVTGEIEVLTGEPPDLFKLTHSPELDDAITTRLRLAEFAAEEQTGWGGEARRRLQGMLWFDGPLPIGVAFEAFAEIGDQRIQSDRPIIESPGGVAGSSHGVGVSFDYDGDAPETINVTLRGSKPAAMRTVDLYEIWDGELRFEDVEVVPPDHISWSRHDDRFAPRVIARESATTQEAAEPRRGAGP